MPSAICTLFENHYHYGLAALVNSLHFHGFRGDVYAGYRGDLPQWSVSAKSNPTLQWPGATSLEISDGVQIHFLPLQTDYHLTNYKAEFILQLWNGPASNANAIAYFDPDIVIKCRWQFFETWMSHGVALVHEIVSNDMPASHPVRMEWEKVVLEINRSPQRKIQSYINGGFCGVSKQNIEFIHIWSDLINIAITKYKADPKKFASFDRTYPFWSIDQDAINIAAMCSEVPVSEMGPEGMDLTGGGWTMSHATGTPKPWKKQFIWSSIVNTRSPTRADRAFWIYANGPIKIFSPSQIKWKRLSISIAAFASRFYRRGT